MPRISKEFENSVLVDDDGDDGETLETCDECGENSNDATIIENEHGSFCEQCFEELFETCNECETVIDVDDARQHNNEVYCDSCYHDKFVICEGCEDTILYDDAHAVNSSVYCDDCYSERFYTCDSCGDVGDRDYMYTNSHNDDYHCRSCHYDIFTNCSNCDEEIYQDDACEHDDDTYCCDCLPNPRNCDCLHSWNYKPSAKFYGNTLEKPYTNLFLGIELECDKGEDFEIVDDLSVNPELYCKEDGSLNDGFEVVSHPMTLGYHQRFNWNGILKQIKHSGFRSYNTQTCGLHVHVSRRVLTPSQEVKLAMLVYTNPEFFQKLAQRENSYGKFKKLNSMNETIEGTKFNNDRFEAINFQNSQTIEFRMFKGTLKHSTFMASIELVHALVSFVTTVKTSDIYNKNMFNSEFRNGIAFRKFCIFVSNSKEYKYLVPYMKHKECFITL